MRAPRRIKVVEELGAGDEAGGCGLLELVPGACPGEKVVSEACDAVFRAVSYQCSICTI